MSLPLIACAMGDPAGVGPETLLRAAGELPPQDGTCVFLGDAAVFLTYAGALQGIEPPRTVASLEVARSLITDSVQGPFLLESARTTPGFVPGSPRPDDSAAALAAVMEGAAAARSGAVDALVTAPLSKHRVAEHAPGFRGHTELLAKLDGDAQPTMVFAAPREAEAGSPDIALLTTHLPLATAIAAVRAPEITRALVRLAGDWRERFGRDPKIGVAGLNPHAGEHGQIGGEEARVIAPAIAAAREQDVDACGPFPADSIFLRTELDVVLALYHDQGTIMAKRAPWPTVNLTLGLSYIRTSPDHGTAYELAGTGRADHAATLAAMRLAGALARGRFNADA